MPKVQKCVKHNMLIPGACSFNLSPGQVKLPHHPSFTWLIFLSFRPGALIPPHQLLDVGQYIDKMDESLEMIFLVEKIKSEFDTADHPSSGHLCI